MTNTVKQSIDYIEIGLCEKKVEVVGLLLNYNFLQDALQIIPKADQDLSYFNLKYFSIVFIKVAHAVKYCESFYTESEKDQDEAKQKLISLITELKREKRCTSNDFIKTETYIRLPTAYSSNKKLATQCVGAITKPVTTNTTVTTPIVTQPTTRTYTYPQQNKILFIKRKTDLPDKKTLKAIHAKVLSGKLEVTLPDLDDDDFVEETVVKNPHYMYNDEYDDLYAGYAGP